MRRTILTSTALALLLLLGGVAIAGAAPEAKPARTLRFDVRFSPFHLVDADGDGAPSLGDYPVFHDILLRDGEEVGDEGGTCPIVDVEQGLIHCTGTMRLPDGQLTFQGLTTTAPTKQLAITGGTGRYQGMGGEATLVELGDGTGTLTVRLRR
jgi:Allene oxide cyclase barrel like domain